MKYLNKIKDFISLTKPEVTWAFWRYDHFPYTLSGPVTQIHDDNGNVSVEGYDGMTFKPLALIPGKRGEELHQWLKAAATSYQEMTESLENSMRDALAEHLESFNIPNSHRFFRQGTRYAGFKQLFRENVSRRIMNGGPIYPYGSEVKDSLTH